MENFVDLSAWLKGAIAVIGLIQLAKNFVTLKPKVWAILVVPIAVGYAYLPEPFQNGLGIAALSQIGYETIIQLVKDKLKAGKE